MLRGSCLKTWVRELVLIAVAKQGIFCQIKGTPSLTKAAVIFYSFLCRFLILLKCGQKFPICWVCLRVSLSGAELLYFKPLSALQCKVVMTAIGKNFIMAFSCFAKLNQHSTHTTSHMHKQYISLLSRLLFTEGTGKFFLYVYFSQSATSYQGTSYLIEKFTESEQNKALSWHDRCKKWRQRCVIRLV